MPATVLVKSCHDVQDRRDRRFWTVQVSDWHRHGVADCELPLRSVEKRSPIEARVPAKDGVTDLDGPVPSYVWSVTRRPLRVGRLLVHVGGGEIVVCAREMRSACERESASELERR